MDKLEVSFNKLRIEDSVVQKSIMEAILKLANDNNKLLIDTMD
jgi:hypothetical protein